MPRGVSWEDLPANVKRRIQASRADERRKADPALPGQSRWQCCACGEVSTSWAAAQRHADDYGHTRIDLILERASDNE